ncbi:MAG: virulence RhuM family protein [Christensenellaceae bacterium]|jgi:hypothetical protein|nr:virulence RhuM family protein [Christensenellaceae bacterium]
MSVSNVIFKAEEEKISDDVRFDEGTVCLTLDQMTMLFDKSRSTINEHIRSIYTECQFAEGMSKRKIGNSDHPTNPANHYNHDEISVGYRVKFLRDTQFRKWATIRLNEYRKGFTIVGERLKNDGERYFRELLQHIRDIRISEGNLYYEVRDVYATAIDYNPKAENRREFPATVQNKMHTAAHNHTAAEVIGERANSEKPMEYKTNYKGDYIAKDTVKVAKNYISGCELHVLNLHVSHLLEFTKLQVLDERTMTMAEWVAELDHQLLGNRCELLTGKDRIAHKKVAEKAEKEFELYRARKMCQLEGAFGRALKAIGQSDGDGGKQ